MFLIVGHSLNIFAIISFVIYLTFKYLKARGLTARRMPWEMGGWLLHILIDIPTHSYQFYPTPLCWPISGWKFNGFSWGNAYFLAVNYFALGVIYFLLRKKKRI